VPLQIRALRDLERGFELRARLMVIAEAHVAGRCVSDHHEVLRLIAPVTDAACQLDRSLVATDRGRVLEVEEMRFAAPVIRLHGDEVAET
jgi:hypothetical protein